MKYFLTSLLLIITLCLKAQADKDSIRKTMGEYLLTIKEKNTSKTLDFMYPRFFDFYSKDTLLNKLNQMNKDSEVIITIQKSTVSAISDVVVVDQIKYALVKYSNTFDMQLLNADAKESIDMMYEMMKERYGKKNVKLNKKTSVFTLTTTGEVYAILDPVYTGWKFLEKKAGLMSILEEFIPTEVLKKL